MFLGDPDTPATFDFAVSLDAIQPGLSSTVAANQQTGESWIDSLARLAPALVLANSQKKLLDIQMDRARQGLPPLDSSQYGLGVTFGLSPQILTAGVALIAVFAFSMLRKSR